ncbi:MAG: hypothetical protein V1789_11015 [PVC group bacterium]
MKSAIVFLILFLPAAGSAYSKNIQFEDFDWGMTLLQVEARAAENNYDLRMKEITGLKPRLEYRTFLRGKDCVVTFSFTPIGQKLYSATVVWDPPSFGVFVQEELKKTYGEPRESIPGANLLVWTRLNTELELLYGRENTRLVYSDIHLWKEGLDEKKMLREQAKEAEEAEEKKGEQESLPEEEED